MEVKKVIACESCNAEFHLKHDMMEPSYQIQFCPFCGEELSESDMEEDE